MPDWAPYRHSFDPAFAVWNVGERRARDHLARNAAFNRWRAGKMITDALGPGRICDAPQFAFCLDQARQYDQDLAELEQHLCHLTDTC